VSAAPKSRVGFISCEICLTHNTGQDHPESSQRLQALGFHFCQTGLLEQLVAIPPRCATLEEIALIHSRDYIKAAERDIKSGAAMLSTGDTNISPQSWNAALWAVGGCLAGVDAVMTGAAQNIFCAVRPPGHHATPTAGMGFCIFNNAAIAARYAQRKYGIGKVLIVDWDLHHGNGTQDAFYADSTVFYMSTHQNGIYPMDLTGQGTREETGAGPARGTNMNRPLAPGCGDGEFIAVFENDLLPAAIDFSPDLVIISAGFDSRQGDPLGLLCLTDQGYKRLTTILRRIAGKTAQGRVVSILEGGYNLAGMSAGAAAHVSALLDN